MPRPLRTAGPYEVVNDPETGPCWFDVTGIPGDTATSAVYTIDDDGTGVHRVMSARRRGEPGALAWVVQAGEVEIVDAQAVKVDGASGEHALRTRPAPDGACCASLTYPPTPRPKRGRKATPDAGSHEAPGKYRCFARIRKTDPAAQAEVWITYGERDLARQAVRIEQGPALDWWYYNLGEVHLNGGGGPLRHDRWTRGALPVAPLPLALHVRDLDDQPGGIEIDHLVFIPADTETAWVTTRPTGNPARLVMDGINRRTYRLNAAGALLPGGSAWHTGRLPVLAAKGRTTRVFLLSGLHGGAPAPLDGTTTVTVQYTAKHLLVAGFPDA